jgi:hypothetical protein
MPTRLVSVVADTADGSALGRFWSALLGWPIAVDDPEEVDVRGPDVGELIFDLVFAPVTDPKVVKNRVHPDLASSSPEHQRALVRRALDAGAAPVDVGQREVPCRTPRATSSACSRPAEESRAQSPARSISPSCSALATSAAFVVAGRPASAYLIRTRLM